VLAVTTDAICRAPGFQERCEALLSLGEDFGMVVRAPGATAAEQARFTLVATAARRGRGAAVFVHARPDLAVALEADGLQLRRNDLSPADARRVFPNGRIGVSVHDRAEAEQAIRDGADYLVVGSVFESTSHPGRPAKGLRWLEALTGLGRPVIAIGGITRERVDPVRSAGASGIAAISAIWDVPDPLAAGRDLLAAWNAGSEALRLTVNGETRRLSAPATLARLLAELDLDARGVVVELNRRIVRRTDLEATPLHDGDAVELVHFVGGG
jgi:thiamine-phosphate pyrophosphorylase